ncbi:MAG: class I SAM-dependent methyltransferase [Clostridia bacterium]
MDRLDTLCSLVKSDATVYDIGCDHGYLLLKLYPKIKRGFALDVAQKPLNTAIKTINENNLSDKVTAILSDGLEKVDPKIADTIVIAGMGAELIIDILSKYNFIYSDKYTFLLQPMTKSELLRQFLYAKGFEIEQEVVSIEERRFYTIMKCKYTGNIIEKDVLDCYVSENLTKDDDFSAYIDYKTKKMSIICDRIEDKSNENYVFYNNLIKKLRGMTNEN